MRVLITGAGGFIGSHVAERCRSLGHHVIGLDSCDPYYSPEQKRATLEELSRVGVTVSECDLKTADLRTLTDVDAIIHLAAQPGNTPGMPLARYWENNVIATERLLDAASQNKNLRQFINISTSSVYGSVATGPETSVPMPISYYGITKLAAEQLVMARHRRDGFPACSLRLFSVYGERERPDKLFPRLIDAILNDRPFPLFAGSADHKRSFSYIGDIVDGILAASSYWDQAVGEVFNIGSDQCILTRDAIAIVEKVIGKKARIELLDPRSGDQYATHANIAKAREKLGYTPRIDPTEGVARMVAWQRSRKLPTGVFA